eukprot:CAMPEP_0172680886 /NCGR_PEP_ID=MMETSP1074-20121228/17081_1 /TAXON_ID=2916 /ORGANISM="Ceratium fusus, Strain PA161109" /LENGTH=68 /DNA_ID=CAMNT_0013499299 /DNA_START=340 /DNA_END=542 /DNA_ORIENTATION=+
MCTQQHALHSGSPSQSLPPPAASQFHAWPVPGCEALPTIAHAPPGAEQEGLHSTLALQPSSYGPGPFP